MKSKLRLEKELKSLKKDYHLLHTNTARYSKEHRDRIYLQYETEIKLIEWILDVDVEYLTKFKDEVQK